ncbi:hypothetical protein PCS8106_01823 [Streptococcus pneumoniae PCS8106]|nr:hypothetical protein PCS8106_01823 [Streptococcus pneumoniae PCS8106]
MKREDQRSILLSSSLGRKCSWQRKQALIDQFRANGTQTYSATVNVYGNKDGKPDLDNIVATKKSLLT